MNLNEIRNIVVLGAGESGVGSALLAKQKSYNVFVSDFGEIKSKYKSELKRNSIEFEEQQHTMDKILCADVVIISPGIPDNSPVVIDIRKHGIDIISEIEFAYHFNNAKTISVTGSNGKTTTTFLTYHILKKAGINVTYGGNVGVSFARRVYEGGFDHIVLEISSFQLDYIRDFRTDIALLLNITPDHLDRYDYDINKYADSKMRIAENQTNKDIFIYNMDDDLIMKKVKKKELKGKMLPFSTSRKVSPGVYLENEIIVIEQIKNKKTSINMSILSLIGKHNLYNSMAASAAATAIDIQDAIVRESLADFQNIEHRLEFVAKIQGIEFINDSKATNINATWYALECMTKDVIWIAGGVDKGNNYEELRHMVNDKVKAIVCLGVDNSKILTAFKDDIELVFDTSSIEEAVKISYKLARSDEVVLLSPACASFDLFKNYEDRGNQFKEAVRNL